MKPEQITSQEKRICYEMAIQVMEVFCKQNKMKMPVIKLSGKTNAPKGDYYKGVINCYIKGNAVPTKVPGYAWSYPGYKADMTPYGVLLHEFGHYIHDYYFKPELNKLPKKETVSSYEPNTGERVAETFKLFCGNPDLLRVLCPTRYNLLIQAGFKPVINKSWREVLSGAHKRYFEVIEKRLK